MKNKRHTIDAQSGMAIFSSKNSALSDFKNILNHMSVLSLLKRHWDENKNSAANRLPKHIGGNHD